jgi:DNA (cytosine-5)-methyltransferase 1
MSKNILIRDLSDDDINWLDCNRSPGVTQNDFLKSLVSEARLNGKQLDLFQSTIIPRTIYGVLPFKFIDLFAGIGGFRVAMTAVGGKCVFTNEWDKYANKTYQTWYRDKNVHPGDIREISNAEIPNHDILCAGFPCQPFSIAGVSKKISLGHSHGFNDPKQGNLFFSILKVIDSKRPPVLFLENVKNLKSHDKGNTWNVIKNSLRDRDYVVFAKTIDAQSWVPQHRERIFIVCFDKNIFGTEDQIDFHFPVLPIGEKPTLKKILQNAPIDKKYMLTDKLWEYLQAYAAKHKAKGNGFGYGLFNGKDIARTMSARYYKDGSEILISQRRWRNPRRLTPRESCLLLGFDDQYAKMFGHENGFPQVVSDTQAYKQFGNSVVPKVVEAIARSILNVVGRVFLKKDECLIKERKFSAL